MALWLAEGKESFVEMRHPVLSFLVLVVITAHPLLPAQDRVPELESPAEVQPGTTGLLRSASGMRYFLHVPRSYSSKTGARLLVFLHGSNMNGLQYLRSFHARKWGEDDIILCPNGEKGEDPYGANNFTFESARYVTEVTRDVREHFEVSRTYIGGHSQGGYVTYSVIMRNPELYQGAFPMASTCWIQNEPNLWEDEPETLEKQRKIAIAVIHGKRDTVVDFGGGQYAHDIYVAMGYPRVRLLAPEKLGHQFMLSPVDEALEWLDAMVGPPTTKTIDQMGAWKKEGEWGWIVQAARRIEQGKAPRKARSIARAALREAELAAKREAETMARLMETAGPDEWVPAWFEFRRRFGETASARKLVEKYEASRAIQRSTGKSLLAKARGLFQEKKDEEAREVLKNILEKAPASYEAYHALRWLAGDD